MIAVRGYAKGLLERAGEMVGTQLGDRGNLGQFHIARQILLDEIRHSFPVSPPRAGVNIAPPFSRTSSWANKTLSASA